MDIKSSLSLLHYDTEYNKSQGFHLDEQGILRRSTPGKSQVLHPVHSRWWLSGRKLTLKI